MRGGLGRFYDFPYTNATILFPAAAVQANYGVAFRNHNDDGIRNPDGSFFQIGQPLPPNQLPPGGDIFPPNEVASPTLATPYSDQLSLGYSWQATNWLGLNIEAMKVRYRDIPYRFRANPIDPATGDFRFPQYGNFRIWYGKGEADYEALNIGFRVRQTKFELQGFYTYSETTGNILAGADEFRITDAGHQSDLGGGRRDVSVNPLNPQCGACFGPLNTDARHRVTFAGTFHAPWAIDLSGMYRYRSALPYTEFIATDLNGDGFAYELPAGDHINQRRGHSFSQFDIRLSRDFEFGDNFGVEVIAEMFNVFNEKNPARYNRDGVPSVYAGDPLQGEQQLMQFGVRFHF